MRWCSSFGRGCNVRWGSWVSLSGPRLPAGCPWSCRREKWSECSGIGVRCASIVWVREREGGSGNGARRQRPSTEHRTTNVERREATAVGAWAWVQRSVRASKIRDVASLLHDREELDPESKIRPERLTGCHQEVPDPVRQRDFAFAGKLLGNTVCVWRSQRNVSKPGRSGKNSSDRTRPCPRQAEDAARNMATARTRHGAIRGERETDCMTFRIEPPTRCESHSTRSSRAAILSWDLAALGRGEPHPPRTAPKFAGARDPGHRWLASAFRARPNRRDGAGHRPWQRPGAGAPPISRWLKRRRSSSLPAEFHDSFTNSQSAAVSRHIPGRVGRIPAGTIGVVGCTRQTGSERAVHRRAYWGRRHGHDAPRQHAPFSAGE